MGFGKPSDFPGTAHLNEDIPPKATPPEKLRNLTTKLDIPDQFYESIKGLPTK